MLSDAIDLEGAGNRNFPDRAAVGQKLTLKSALELATASRTADLVSPKNKRISRKELSASKFCTYCLLFLNGAPGVLRGVLP